ncbi:MAG: hypothetical protein A2096_13990 [Spirochaetes bacterium GWF1_41_5]|nr:MAG: hypothetical protein A2096_13990 [Spirochaetes bacterium GWF1_41_5]
MAETGKKMKYYILLGIVILTAAGLRLYRLDYHSMWDDEARTYLAGTTDTLGGALSFTIAVDYGTPPGNLLPRYLLTKIFGKSTYVFTLPSVIFSLLGIFLYFLLFSRLAGNKTALLACILIAIHPEEISYAMTPRNYAVLNTVIPLSFLLLILAVKKQKYLWYFFHGISLALCYYAHLLTAGIALSQGVIIIFLLLSGRGNLSINRLRLFTGFSLSIAVSAVLFLPWLLELFKIKLHTSLNPFVSGPSWHSPLDIVYIFVFGRGPFKIITLLLVLPGILKLYKDKPFLPVALVEVLAVSAFVSWLLMHANFFHVRYVIFLLPVFLLLPAAGIAEISEKLRQIFPRYKLSAAVSLLLVLFLFASSSGKLADWYRKGRAYDGNWKEAAHRMQSLYQPGDAIIIPYFHAMIFSVYSSLPVYFINNSAPSFISISDFSKYNRRPWKNINLNLYNGKQYAAEFGGKNVWLLCIRNLSSAENTDTEGASLSRFTEKTGVHPCGEKILGHSYIYFYRLGNGIIH